jgi:hypothetical protein
MRDGEEKDEVSQKVTAKNIAGEVTALEAAGVPLTEKEVVDFRFQQEDIIACTKQEKKRAAENAKKDETLESGMKEFAKDPVQDVSLPPGYHPSLDPTTFTPFSSSKEPEQAPPPPASQPLAPRKPDPIPIAEHGDVLRPASECFASRLNAATSSKRFRFTKQYDCPKDIIIAFLRGLHHNYSSIQKLDGASLVSIVKLAEKIGYLRIFEQHILNRLSKAAKMLKAAADDFLHSDDVVQKLARENVN